MKTITFKRPDEETLNIYVDGKHVENANHDDHGWRGMEEVEARYVAIAKQNKIEIKTK